MSDSLDIGEYEFLDFGCSAGGSIGRHSRHFRVEGKGLGLDIDPKKVEAAKAAGHDAMVCDLRQVDFSRKARFIVMSHFLEHVPDINDVRAILLKACQAAREFVFIRQPYFDADPYLFRMGLKLYWSDWTGHPNHMTLLQFHNLLRPLHQRHLFARFCLYGIYRIEGSDSPYVHNLDSPVNQHQWDPELHPPKPFVRFDLPVYKEVLAVLDLTGGNVPAIERIFRQADKLFDSAHQTSLRLPLTEQKVPL